MKIQKIIITVSALTLFYSCAATKVVRTEESIKEEKSGTEEAPVSQEKKAEEEKTQAAESEKSKNEQAEYLRSTEKVNVSKETFLYDKKCILEIIKDLDRAMKENDYERWLPYVKKESITYWSDRKNLEKVSLMLPVSRATGEKPRLKTLGDYFVNVFIPSRRGKKISEIRYIDEKSLKAISIEKIKGKDTDVSYYTFSREGEKWLIELPGL